MKPIKSRKKMLIKRIRSYKEKLICLMIKCLLKQENSIEKKDEALNVLVNNLEDILFDENNEAKFNEKEKHRIKDLLAKDNLLKGMLNKAS